MFRFLKKYYVNPTLNCLQNKAVEVYGRGPAFSGWQLFIEFLLRFEVLASVSTKMTISWGKNPSSMIEEFASSY
jgi:hypothetical protein